MASASHRPDPAASDPVVRRRRQVERWVLLANRIGYLVLAVSVALFVVAFVLGFNATMSTLIVATLVLACILLAPSIVLGYAVKAADRADAEQGW